ncbi:helix-turn-helix domain-containing protein [Streptomyces sp. WAC05858]|nr:helix-turn-helix domain-containing protein [Streptomyces sp. WAC05858]
MPIQPGMRVTGTWTVRDTVDSTGRHSDGPGSVARGWHDGLPGAPADPPSAGGGPHMPPADAVPDSAVSTEAHNQDGLLRQTAAAFAAELIRLRTGKGLSQPSLARRMGYDKSYVSHVERGNQAPTQPFAHQADHVLGSGEALKRLWQAYHNARTADRQRPHHAPPPAQSAPNTPQIPDRPQTSRENISATLATGHGDAQFPYARPPALPTPQQLPPQAAYFTGRTAELSKLDSLLGSDKSAPLSTIVVTTIAGTAGIGKTSLAVRWAHSAQHRFPDGQLYINLRGYDPDPPLTPGHALDFFLRSLGLPAERIPQDVEAMAGMYRSALAGRRVLVVLDNASTPEQVRPLLPNDPRCMVVVISRNRLSGLVARDGAHRVTLDVLTPYEAASLMGEIIGSNRVNAEPDAVIQLAQQCAYLPLALRVAAERVAGRPHLTVSDLAEELAVEHSRLDTLAADDDEATAVRTVLSWSYHALPPEAARVFRLLALHPGPDISLNAVAALTGITPTEAGQQLDVLVAVHLLAASRRDRFQFHDLLRAYASERVNTDEPAEPRDIATQRLFNWYLHTAHAALFALNPHHPELPIDPVNPDCRPPGFTDHEHARSWFAVEHANLMAIIRHAPTTGQHTIGWQLPQVVDGYLADYCQVNDSIAIHQLGLACAQQLDHQLGQSWAYCHLGEAYERARQYDEAIDCLQHGLAIARKIGDGFGEQAKLIDLGSVYNKLGLYSTAADHSRQALAICRAMDHKRNEGLSLTQLGSALLGMGELDQAMIHLHQSLKISNKLGSAHLQAFTLQSMAEVFRKRGQDVDAVDHLKKAAALYQEQRVSIQFAEILKNLGIALNGMGRTCEAQDVWEEALAVLIELDPQQADQVSQLLEHSVRRNQM